jgi:hypothetical protein
MRPQVDGEGIMTKLFWAAGLALLMLQTAAQAQAPRTYVAGNGNDANPCSRTAPCRTFAGAISKTAASGIISVIDTGGYGSVTISKSISIIAEGVQAGIVTTGNNGIIINAGAGDAVHLQGLFIQAEQPGGNGIQITSAGTVRVSRCLISGYNSGAGINLASTAATKLIVSDCEIAANEIGVAATQDNAEIVLDRVRLVGHRAGILSKNNNSVFHLNGSVLAFNDTAIGPVGGKILSTQTNALVGNGSDGQGMGQESLK